MAKRFRKPDPIARATNSNIPSRKFYSYSSDRRGSSGGTNRESPNKEQLKRPRLSLKLTVERVSLLGLLAVIALCSIYISTLSTNPKVAVQNNEKSKLLHSEEEYQTVLQDILEGSILNKSKLTIDTDKIGTKLSDKFPEITDVNVLLPLVGRRPTAEIKTDAVKLIVVSNNEAFGVGRSGKVLIRIKDRPELAENLPRVIDDTNLESKLGTNILTEQDVAYILNVIDQFDAKKIAIESVTLPQLAAEMHIRPKGEGYLVKFSFLTDYKIAVGQYLSLRKKLSSEGISPKQYIDSRVEERIFYK